ncbi:hypothetical protein [Aquisalimonas asiatica]|uniref:5-bromo-4-chloroindolyl phosphate hydrolysis protein n=1 Tax=Aquisalimonas asiatica TaxID=406100 RepID=A0A1H8UNJ1_9GAMM|nr:hypothetical protein [Aquisalimonas asiatica]SEP04543.1 hypothetical protein SAMN04488052_107106 [Aquisalimonas asiatica]
MQPFETARELVAGLVGAAAVLIAHFGLTLPHWGIAGVDLALAGGAGVALYVGVRLAWSTRPGWLERMLGVDVGLRLPGRSDDPADLQAALRHTVDTAHGRVSEPMQMLLDRIDQAIQSVLDSDLASMAGRQAQFTVAATVNQYLPDTLDRYLQLPEDVAVSPVDQGGQTPHDMVVEQLDVLAGEMEAILADMHAGKVRELSAHGRFLEDRFSRADDLLD